MKKSAAISFLTIVSFVNCMDEPVGSVEVKMSDGSIFGDKLEIAELVPFWMRPCSEECENDFPEYYVYIRTLTGRDFHEHSLVFGRIEAFDTHDPKEHLPERATVRLYDREYSTLTNFEDYDQKHPHRFADLKPHGRLYVAVRGTKIIKSAKLKLASTNERQRFIERVKKPKWEFQRHTPGL